jgi:hypothetical protein
MKLLLQSMLDWFLFLKSSGVVVAYTVWIRHGPVTYQWSTSFCMPRVAFYQWRDTRGVQPYATGR